MDKSLTISSHIWFISWFAIITAALYGAIVDQKTGRIPNIFTGLLLVAGIVWRIGTGGGSGLFDSFLSILILAVPFIFLYALAGGGAGDAKLAGAIGAWFNPRLGMQVLACILICGGIIGIFIMIRRKRSRNTLSNLSHILLWFPYILAGPGKLNDRRSVMPDSSSMTNMPYGLAIFAGCCVAALGVNLWHW